MVNAIHRGVQKFPSSKTKIQIFTIQNKYKACLISPQTMSRMGPSSLLSWGHDKIHENKIKSTTSG